MWRDLFRLVDVESIGLLVTQVFFRLNMPQTDIALRHKTVFVENRNHVWRDLFRLVDVESIGLLVTQVFFRLNMPQTGSATQDCFCGEQEPCVEGSLQVS